MKLPLWKDCNAKPSADRTVLEEFVYQNEPATDELEWRRSLVKVLDEQSTVTPTERAELEQLRALAAGKATIPSVIAALGPMSLWSEKTLNEHIAAKVQEAALSAAQPVAQEAITWSPAGYNKELAVDATGKVRGEVCEHSIDPRWDARANDTRLGEYLNRDQAKAAVLAALATPQPSQRAPIDMVLHCPACGKQHIDAQEITDVAALMSEVTWANPPHRSHLCHGCGHIWRPADVPTNGVAAVKTKGKADSPIAAPNRPVSAEAGKGAVGEKAHPGRTPPDYKILNEVAAQALAMRVERLAAPMPQPEPTSKGEEPHLPSDGDYLRWAQKEGAKVNWDFEGPNESRVSFANGAQWGRFCDAVRAAYPPSQQREPQEAAERPANFTELWELYSRVGDAHENHGRNHEKTMEARATFHAALMRALSAPQEASKVEAVADEGEVSDEDMASLWLEHRPPGLSCEEHYQCAFKFARAVLALARKAKEVRNG